jgi:hypothetical protein
MIIEMMAEAARLFGVPVSDLKGPRHYHKIVRARDAIILAVRRRSKGTISYSRLGNRLGGRDHSTICTAYNRALEREKRDEDFRAKLEQLMTYSHPLVDRKPIDELQALEALRSHSNVRSAKEYPDPQGQPCAEDGEEDVSLRGYGRGGYVLRSGENY